MILNESWLSIVDNLWKIDHKTNKVEITEVKRNEVSYENKECVYLCFFHFISLWDLRTFSLGILNCGPLKKSFGKRWPRRHDIEKWVKSNSTRFKSKIDGKLLTNRQSPSKLYAVNIIYQCIYVFLNYVENSSKRFVFYL